MAYAFETNRKKLNRCCGSVSKFLVTIGQKEQIAVWNLMKNEPANRVIFRHSLFHPFRLHFAEVLENVERENDPVARYGGKHICRMRRVWLVEDRRCRDFFRAVLLQIPDRARERQTGIGDVIDKKNVLIVESPAELKRHVLIVVLRESVVTRDREGCDR